MKLVMRLVIASTLFTQARRVIAQPSARFGTFKNSSSPSSPAHHAKVHPHTVPRASLYGTPDRMPLQYDQNPIVFKPEAHSATVIMLHGLGDTGSGWADIVPEFSDDPAMQHIKWILPTAPRRPITLNNGYVMTGWYDIPSLDRINSMEDAGGLHGSREYIESLIAKEEASGVPSNRIVVAGFSQGGAVSLLMLRSEKKLAGVVGLSTYLPLHQEEGVISAANKGTPVFMAHGTADMVVSFDFGNRSQEKLVSLGANVEWMTVPGMGHSAAPKELDAFAKFLKKVLPKQ